MDERLLTKCQSHWNTTSLELCDRIVHELQMYRQNLTEITEDVNVSSSHNTASRDLLVFNRCTAQVNEQINC